jgi:hypothetical protein
MSVEILCGDCGRRLRVQDELRGRAVKCPACGGRIQAVSDLLQTAPSAGEGASSCPGCGAAMAAGAVLCIDCGYHLGKGAHLKTRHKRLRRVWDAGRTLARRLLAFIGVLLFGGALAMRLMDSPFWGWAWAPAAVIVAAAVLLLTPLGFQWRVVLESDPRGGFRLSKRQWVCLMPLGGWSIRLDGQDRAYIDFVFTGRDRWGRKTGGYYTLGVARGRSDAPFVVYRGGNERLMQDIADGLHDLAGLRLERR